MNYVRLKKQTDFQKLFNKGKRSFSPSLTVLYQPFSTLRMGISIGKKHGKAVQRNRIKRLIREAFRAVSKEIKGKYSIVIVPKVKDEYEFKKFKKELQCIIKKENL